MAGGGVGEAMLIGAAVGAGTGGVMSAVKDEDPLQGALLGAAMGAAGGGIGSAVGGAGSALTQTGAQAAGTGSSLTGAGFQNALGQAMAQGGEQAAATSLLGQAGSGAAQMTPGLTQAALSGGSNVGAMAGQGAMSIPGIGSTASGMTGVGAVTGGAGGSTASWGAQGIGQGFAPALTNAQAYGAGVGGGIMGLIGQSAQNQNNMAPGPETYTGPLSQFKYSPNTFRPSIAPGYADGGVASLGRQAGMYPQSQYDKTQFAVPSQMPISREVIGSDYDARISPYTGDMMMASGGISNLGSYSDGGRLLRGPGDGMSDDIPASIGRKQPARLADGEFVVPADVVSGIGNGSTDAGAKKLYGMMDNIRKARTGTKKQGKSIKADKYIPGYADGGVPFGEAGYDKAVVEQAQKEAAQNAAVETAAAAPATVPGQGAVATGFQATGYEPSQQYSPYTMANRPSSTQPQYYGDIYQGSYPDYSTPGYTLAGNLGRWSNVAGESQRAAQPASMNQQVTQSYLQNLGRSPDTEGFNYWMRSGIPTDQINRQIQLSPEAAQIGSVPSPTDYISGLYQQYLGRTPDTEGAQYWQQQLGANLSAEQVAQAIKNSEEAKARTSKTQNKRRGGIASLV